jgi:hypothetical protein
MRRTVEVKHQQWIDASPAVVRAQFADVQHHIDANVHPNLRFELLVQEPQRARFRQQVKLLGMWQTDLFERTIDDDGTMHDVSIDGFNKGGTLDFTFTPSSGGTTVGATIRIPTPPLLGWLAPLLEKQVRNELRTAFEQDKKDIEKVYKT